MVKNAFANGSYWSTVSFIEHCCGHSKAFNCDFQIAEGTESMANTSVLQVDRDVKNPSQSYLWYISTFWSWLPKCPD